MAELDRTTAERLVTAATGQAAAGSADGICSPCPGFVPNRAMVRLMGARDADSLQQHIGLVVPPERVDDLARFGSAALADGESEVTLALRKVDGLSVVLRLHASVPSGDGEPMLLSATEVTGDAELFRPHEPGSSSTTSPRVRLSNDSSRSPRRPSRMTLRAAVTPWISRTAGGIA